MHVHVSRLPAGRTNSAIPARRRSVSPTGTEFSLFTPGAEDADDGDGDGDGFPLARRSEWARVCFEPSLWARTPRTFALEARRFDEALLHAAALAGTEAGVSSAVAVAALGKGLGADGAGPTLLLRTKTPRWNDGVSAR